MTTKRITASHVAADLAISKKENEERWKTPCTLSGCNTRSLDTDALTTPES